MYYISFSNDEPTFVVQQFDKLDVNSDFPGPQLVDFDENDEVNYDIEK